MHGAANQLTFGQGRSSCRSILNSGSPSLGQGSLQKSSGRDPRRHRNAWAWTSFARRAQPYHEGRSLGSKEIPTIL